MLFCYYYYYHQYDCYLYPYHYHKKVSGADLLDESISMLMKIQIWVGLCDGVQVECKAASPLVTEPLGHVCDAGFLQSGNPIHASFQTYAVTVD